MADHLLPGERMWGGRSTGLQRCTGKLWVDVTAMIPTAMTISQTYTHVKTYKLTLFKYMWLIICQVSSTKLFKICVDLNCLDKTSKNLHCAKEKLRSDSNYSKNMRSTKEEAEASHAHSVRNKSTYSCFPPTRELKSWKKNIYDLQSQNTDYVALHRASLLLLLSTRDYMMIYE